MKHTQTRGILGIILPYIAFASLWILVSDRILDMLPLDASGKTLVSILKGWAYVLVTALLLWALFHRELMARERERRQSLQALGDLNASLERRVAERTAELAIEKEHAEAADRLKSAFLATMSHELRTPLNSIIGFTGIILQELAGPLTTEQRKQLGMVRKSARHLLALINDVLDISKIEAGQLEIHKESFDLRASLEKIEGIAKPLAEEKGLTLTVRTQNTIGTLVSDARRIEQILLNLINNAIKFTDSGGVTLEASVEASGTNMPERLRLSVSDTGIGIKPEDMEMLFKPFRQIDSSLTRQHEGTGLGLAICRRLCEMMGGEMQVASVWGKGSTFTCTLPIESQRGSCS